MRSDDPVLFPESRFPEKLSDTTSAKDSPDLELFITPAGYKVGFYVLMNDDKDADSEFTVLIRTMRDISLT